MKKPHAKAHELEIPSKSGFAQVPQLCANARKITLALPAGDKNIVFKFKPQSAKECITAGRRVVCSRVTRQIHPHPSFQKDSCDVASGWSSITFYSITKYSPRNLVRKTTKHLILQPLRCNPSRCRFLCQWEQLCTQLLLNVVSSNAQARPPSIACLRPALQHVPVVALKIHLPAGPRILIGWLALPPGAMNGQSKRLRTHGHTIIPATGSAQQSTRQGEKAEMNQTWRIGDMENERRSFGPSASLLFQTSCQS